MLHYSMTVCRGDPGVLPLTAHFIHRLSTLQEQPPAPDLPNAFLQWWWQFLTSKKMVSRVGNERQQEKAAGRAASLHKGSSLRTQLLDHCGSLQSKVSGRVWRHTCVLQSPFQEYAQRNIKVFFWDMWDGLGTLKEIWGCFSPRVLFYYFSVLLNVFIGIPISVPVSWAKQRWRDEVLWAL